MSTIEMTCTRVDVEYDEWKHLDKFRKIDIMMHWAQEEGMDAETAAGFIKHYGVRNKWHVAHDFIRNHGDAEVTRVDDDYINFILGHIGCHVGKRGGIVRGVVPGTPTNWEPRMVDKDPADGAAFVAWGFGLLSAIVLTFIWVMN